MFTEAMKDRENLGVKWFIHDSGYGALAVYAYIGKVAYISLPEGHPLIGRDYMDLPDGGPDVNGGLTYGEDNVFGWDYSHYINEYDYPGDFTRALKYFVEQAELAQLPTPLAQLSSGESDGSQD